MALDPASLPTRRCRRYLEEEPERDAQGLFEGDPPSAGVSSMSPERLVIPTLIAVFANACGQTPSARAEGGRGQAARPADSLQSGAPMSIHELPAPRPSGPLSLEEALRRRRSVREFEGTALTDEEIAQLSWAAQGRTSVTGLRTAPSAGALYPLEVYVALPGGLYRFDSGRHALEMRSDRDLRPELQRAGLGQDAIGDAPAVFVISGAFERTEVKYGPRRTPRYVHMEAGHAAQNLLLQAVALGLGAVPIGAFYDDSVREVLSLPEGERPLYLIPVGHPLR